MLDDQNGKQKVMYDLLAPRSRHAQTAAFFSHPTVWVENKQASKLFDSKTKWKTPARGKGQRGGTRGTLKPAARVGSTPRSMGNASALLNSMVENPCL